MPTTVPKVLADMASVQDEVPKVLREDLVTELGALQESADLLVVGPTVVVPAAAEWECHDGDP